MKTLADLKARLSVVGTELTLVESTRSGVLVNTPLKVHHVYPNVGLSLCKKDDTHGDVCKHFEWPTDESEIAILPDGNSFKVTYWNDTFDLYTIKGNSDVA